MRLCETSPISKTALKRRFHRFVALWSKISWSPVHTTTRLESRRSAFPSSRKVLSIWPRWWTMAHPSSWRSWHVVLSWERIHSLLPMKIRLQPSVRHLCNFTQSIDTDFPILCSKTCHFSTSFSQSKIRCLCNSRATKFWTLSMFGTRLICLTVRHLSVTRPREHPSCLKSLKMSPCSSWWRTGRPEKYLSWRRSLRMPSSASRNRLPPREKKRRRTNRTSRWCSARVSSSASVTPNMTWSENRLPKSIRRSRLTKPVSTNSRLKLKQSLGHYLQEF